MGGEDDEMGTIIMKRAHDDPEANQSSSNKDPQRNNTIYIKHQTGTTQLKTISKMTEPTAMEALLGSDLLANVKGPAKKTKELLKGKDLVLLYFSANWCSPCKTFSPILAQFYNAIAKDAKLEIVYISSDRTVEDFDSYYGKMPWLSIPLVEGSAQIKNNLSQTLKIAGIPTLVVLDAKTGEFITGLAREEVTAVGGNKAKAKELAEKWNQKERVALAEANMGGGSQGGLMGILMYFAKNPMYIFGLLYMVKLAMKQWALYTKLQEGSGAAVPPVMEDEPEDTEF
jgi:nucleoredoxin